MTNIYEKLPARIEAKQLTMETMSEIMSWVPGAKYWSKPPMRALTGLLILTLESLYEVSFGDFIIKGVSGEFYPCKPEIFKKTYGHIVTTNELLNILGLEPDELEEETDTIPTHDGKWVNLDNGEWRFEWSVFE